MLDELGWHATFFMLGDMVRALARRRRARSRRPDTRSRCTATSIATCCAARRARPRDDIDTALDTIAAATGAEPRWFRPPFGILSSSALRAGAVATSMSTVLWTTWGRDWRREATPDTVVADVTRRYLDGGTVLLHDSDCESYPGSWKSTIGALPRLAEEFAARGLTVGTLGDHGIEPAGTTTYPR